MSASGQLSVSFWAVARSDSSLAHLKLGTKTPVYTRTVACGSGSKARSAAGLRLKPQ